jgi:hypothetical protein
MIPTLTAQALSRYLGKPSSAMLSDPPFRDWRVERSVETGLGEIVIDYVFPEHGIEMQADARDHLSVLFLSSGSICLSDLPFALTRAEVGERCGEPAKSGNGLRDPILGDYGPWDRFSNDAHALHVEFRADVDRIAKITLMRPDVVPG